jgi:hypothetical protein
MTNRIPQTTTDGAPEKHIHITSFDTTIDSREFPHLAKYIGNALQRGEHARVAGVCAWLSSLSSSLERTQKQVLAIAKLAGMPADVVREIARESFLQSHQLVTGVAVDAVADALIERATEAVMAENFMQAALVTWELSAVMYHKASGKIGSS